MPSATRRSIWLFLMLLAAGAFAAGTPAGCAGSVPCQLNSDCPFGYCQNGSCQKNCVDASRDCPVGYICNQNAECVPPVGAGGGASSSTGTGTGTGGAAATSSSGTGGTGPSTSSGAGASTTASSTSSTTTTASSSSSTTSTTSSSTSGGTMNKTELDLCTSDGECVAPLVCRPMYPGAAQRCTRTCSSSAACMTGTRCNLIGSSMYCSGDDTGRACTTATAATCNFACLINQYCTNNCVTGSDCPNGYGCMAVSGQRVCVKAEAPCDTGDATACIAPAACDVSPQLVVGGCTLVCNTAADCPQRAAGFNPWSCDAGGICRRPSDVYGPLQNGATPAQYACDPNLAGDAVVNVCNDNQHIDYQAFNFPNPPQVSCSATTTTAGIASDSCVDSCRYQGSCPYGFACTGVGSLGAARVGLCLPTGGGEVGAPCVHDSDCVFGYCPSALGKCSRDCTGDGVCPTGSTCTAAGGPPVEGAPFRRCQ